MLCESDARNIIIAKIDELNADISGITQINRIKYHDGKK